MSAKHSSASNSHYTPKPIVDAARETMGWIDLDPASCELANRIVGAPRFFTEENDGLDKAWHGRLFLNPPGGKLRGKSQATLWWQHLVAGWELGDVTEAVFVAFSLEFLQTGQSSGYSPLGFPFCIPKRRLNFWTPNADGTDLIEGTSPTHANAIIYLPPRVGTRAAAHRFRAAFRGIGDVVIPTLIAPVVSAEAAE